MIEIPFGVRLKVLNLNEFKKSVGSAASAKAGGTTGGTSAGKDELTGIIAKGNFLALAAQKVLEKMADLLRGIFDKMKSASPALQGILLTFEKAMMIFFKPFGDFLALLLRPMALLLIKFARDWAKGLKGIIPNAKDVGNAIGGTVSGFIGGGGAGGEGGKPGIPGAAGETGEPGTTNVNLNAKDVADSIGKSIITFLGDLGTELAKKVNTFAPDIASFIAKLSDMVFSFIVGLGFAIFNFLKDLKIEQAGKIATEILLGIGKLLMAVIMFIIMVITGLLIFVFNALKDNADAIWTLINIYVIEPLGKFFGRVVGVLEENFNELRDDVIALWRKVTAKVTEIRYKFITEIETWKTNIGGILTTLYNNLSNALSDIGNRVKKIIDEAFSVGSRAVNDIWNQVLGKKQVGSDFIPETGMYMLHRGEQVVPTTRQAPTRPMNVSFGNVVINVPSGTELDEDRLARKIAEQQRLMLRRAMSYG